MDISNLKRDSTKVEGGQWVDNIPGMEDIRLRVRGLSSKHVAALRSRKERKVSRDGREADGSLKQEVALRILGEVLHEAVLLDWDGLSDGGKPLPFNSEIALEWLSNPDFTPFADAVVWAAGVVDRGRKDAKDNLEKNSRKSSPEASTATT